MPVLLRPCLRRGLLPIALATALLTPKAAGQLAPLPSAARSAEVTGPELVLRTAPSVDAPRRGTVPPGTRLPICSRVSGPGCSAWLRVGPKAYACQERTRLSRRPPSPPAQGAAGNLLPHRYVFVASDGARGYARPSDVNRDTWVEAYGEGFGFPVREEVEYEGQLFYRNQRGLYVVAAATRPARPSTFAGIELQASSPASSTEAGQAALLGLGWVRRDGVPLRATPGGRILRRLKRRTLLRPLSHLQGHAPGTKARWLQVAGLGVVQTRDLQLPELHAAPPEVGAEERWIDVDTRNQLLVAYQGSQAVFATLVSTGKKSPPDSEEQDRTETPLGVHRIWVKLAHDTMDDLERDDVVQNYSIEDIPWVQYFQGGNGFHAAFWHDAFGRRRSHGCVNLAPLDARWLFDFTAPALPAGWKAVLPTRHDQGTVVRVR